MNKIRDLILSSLFIISLDRLKTDSDVDYIY